MPSCPALNPKRTRNALKILAASFLIGAALGSATAWLLVTRVAQAQEAMDG